MRRDGDPMFKNLRNHDLYLVAMHASEMFWIASDDEVDVHELYQNGELNERRNVRSAMASGSNNA